MPAHPRNQQRQPCDDHRPEREPPVAPVPTVPAERPERERKVGDVAEEQGREQRGDDVLLRRRRRGEVLARGGEHEVVEDAEEGADVSELGDRDEGCGGQGAGRRGPRRPRCLHVVRLDANA